LHAEYLVLPSHIQGWGLFTFLAIALSATQCIMFIQFLMCLLEYAVLALFFTKVFSECIGDSLLNCITFISYGMVAQAG